LQGLDKEPEHGIKKAYPLRGHMIEADLQKHKIYAKGEDSPILKEGDLKTYSEETRGWRIDAKSRRACQKLP